MIDEMSTRKNKAIVRRFYEELWNERRIEIADEIFGPDCLTHQLQSGAEDVGAPRNAEAVKHHVAQWLASFEDLRFDVEEMVSDGGRVVSRCIAHGNHTEPGSESGRRASVSVSAWLSFTGFKVGK